MSEIVRWRTSFVRNPLKGTCRLTAHPLSRAAHFFAKEFCLGLFSREKKLGMFSPQFFFCVLFWPQAKTFLASFCLFGHILRQFHAEVLFWCLLSNFFANFMPDSVAGVKRSHTLRKFAYCMSNLPLRAGAHRPLDLWKPTSCNYNPALH